MYIMYKYIYYIYIVDTVLMLRCVAFKKFLFYSSSCGKLSAVIFYDIVGQVNVSGELKYDLYHATCKT